MSKKSNLLFTLDLLILSILKEKDCYGYELIKIISQETKELVIPKMGTLYPVLYNLLENNYISSYEIYIKTKPRIYYHIEEKGYEYLDLLIQDFDNMVNTLTHLIHKENNNEQD